MQNYLPVVYWQQDPTWKLQRLGTCNGITLGDSGCYVTSLAMVSEAFGVHVTPQQLDTKLTPKNPPQPPQYVQGCLVADGMLQGVYPQIQYVGTFHYESIPADLAKLNQITNDPTMRVILAIDLGGGYNHFVVCYWTDGKNIQIANPWTGKIEDFRNLYGDPLKNILKFVVYKGNPVVTQPTTPTPNPYPAPVGDNNTKKAVHYDRIISYLFSINMLPTDHSENYLDNETVLFAIQKLKKQ